MANPLGSSSRAVSCSLWFLLVQMPSLLHAYNASWESLAERPLPAWYNEAKFGIFIHWGVFSVPAFRTEWFWWVWKNGTDHQKKEFGKFVEDTEAKNFAYQDYAHRFNAQFFNADDWAKIFAKSGAQYVVLTSKHHEGFCNWDSRSLHHTWNWNAMDIGPRRDLVGELSEAVKKVSSRHTKQKLRFGLYHSLFEWYNPMYREDEAKNFTTNHFAHYKSIPELYDLVEKYQPEIIWSDGDGRRDSDYWEATKFLAWYATNSTVAETAVWNDRWGHDASCKYGSFLTCKDKFQPGSVQSFKWESCYTLDKSSWGYNRMAQYDDYETVEGIIHLLIETVAYNGNLLLNVGPSADGTISPIFVDRLRGVGDWLSVNGEAIFKTTPWAVCQNETASGTFYTTKNDTLYALMTKWPENNRLILSCPKTTNMTSAELVGFRSDSVKLSVAKPNKRQPLQKERSILLEESPTGLGLELDLPPLNPATTPSQYAWVVALTGIGNMKSVV